MNKVVLDFTGVAYIGEIHKILKEGLGLPDYYGNNLDALWDCLSVYHNDCKIYIQIEGLGTLPGELDDYIEKMLDVFKDVSQQTKNIVFEVC